MRYQFFKLFNALVGMIPTPILRRMLQAMHYHPEIGDRAGYIIFPKVFYSPFPDPDEVDFEKIKVKRELPGVNFNPAATEELVREGAQFSGEISEFLKQRPANLLKKWNMTYAPADSGTLYAMLRQLKPKRYIEVGCGYSSRCSAAALKRNLAEGSPCEATYIDPYPSPVLAGIELPGKFVKQKIERIPLEVFQALESGDVLFIDTSHVIKMQNDCEYEFIHVLPSLKPGVYVHIHDIYTPFDYPVDWSVGPGTQRGASNEQYAMECLLSGGGDWETVLPVHQLWREQRQLLAPMGGTDDRPTAYWIRKLKATTFL